MKIVRVDNLVIVIKPNHNEYMGSGNATHICFALDNRDRWASGNSERAALLNFLELLDIEGVPYYNEYKAN